MMLVIILAADGYVFQLFDYDFRCSLDGLLSMAASRLKPTQSASMYSSLHSASSVPPFFQYLSQAAQYQGLNFHQRPSAHNVFALRQVLSKVVQ